MTPEYQLPKATRTQAVIRNEDQGSKISIRSWPTSTTSIIPALRNRTGGSVVLRSSLLHSQRPAWATPDHDPQKIFLRDGVAAPVCLSPR